MSFDEFQSVESHQPHRNSSKYEFRWGSMRFNCSNLIVNSSIDEFWRGAVRKSHRTSSKTDRSMSLMGFDKIFSSNLIKAHWSISFRWGSRSFKSWNSSNLIKGTEEYIDKYLRLKVDSKCAFNIASFIINYNLLESQGSYLIEDIFFFSFVWQLVS